MESKSALPASVINYKKDALILMEGEENPGYIFIVKSGTVKIDSKIKFNNKNMNFYAPGDVFGFVSAILKQKHGQNLYAGTDCEILKLTVNQFLVFIRQKPDSFIKFLSYYTEKYRIMMDTKDSPEDVKGLESSPEKLFLDAKKYMKLEQNDKAAYALHKYIHTEFPIKKRPEKVEEAKTLLESLQAGYVPAEIIPVDDGFQYQDGQIIFLKNEPDDYMYVIESGSVTISMLYEETEIILETIHKGEIFGEMAILNKKARMATAIARGETVLKRYDFKMLLERAADSVLIKIFFVLAKRFNLANQRIYIRKVEDINLKFYLQVHLLLADMFTEGISKKSEFTIDYSFDQVANMIGVNPNQRDKFTDFIKDKALKFNEKSITVNNGEEFEHRVSIMKNRYTRMMKDTVL